LRQTLDPLGDGISSVELLWVAGSDLEVVNDARESLDKEHEVFIEPDDSRLIRYLAQHHHWTPFAGSLAKFRIKMPIFVAREWYRHTVGFNRNEVSRRYVDSRPEVYAPRAWRLRAPGVKQGSLETTIESATTDFYSRQRMFEAVDAYHALLDEGVAPEMARMVLPQSMYTEFREVASLYAYARLCQLRIAPNAQLETRKYAEAVSTFMEQQFPISWRELRAAAAPPDA
jgi:thymidylate synthase (FAD)